MANHERGDENDSKGQVTIGATTLNVSEQNRTFFAFFIEKAFSFVQKRSVRDLAEKRRKRFISSKTLHWRRAMKRLEQNGTFSRFVFQARKTFHSVPTVPRAGWLKRGARPDRSPSRCSN
jgi:hypothetical protein